MKKNTLGIKSGPSIGQIRMGQIRIGQINSIIMMVLGLLLLSSSSAQVIDLQVDSFAQVNLVSSTALSDVGFNAVVEDSFVREITKPVGRIHMSSLDGVKSCTGTLVREDIILTSSSCLPNGQIVATNFRLGYLSEARAGEVFSVENTPVAMNADLGYMLLRVNSDAVVNYGFLPLYIEEAEVGSSLSLVQHALSAPMSLSKNCEITASNGDIFEHTCPSAPGASGGLLFDKFGYPVGMQLEEGLGISLLTLANSDKIIAEMYNLTSDVAIDVDAIDESAVMTQSTSSSIVSSLSSSSMTQSSTNPNTEVSDLAPVTVETTVTTTPLTTTSTESGNTTVSNNATNNTISSLSAPAQVAWSILAEGAQGSAQEPSVYLIQSQRKLQEVWTIANANFVPVPTMPTVDFRNTSILAVFLGIKPSGGHSVEIANMINRATGLDVSLQINEPGSGMFATMALTSPWVMVEVTGATLSNINIIDGATGASFVTNIR